MSRDDSNPPATEPADPQFVSLQVDSSQAETPKRKLGLIYLNDQEVPDPQVTDLGDSLDPFGGLVVIGDSPRDGMHGWAQPPDWVDGDLSEQPGEQTIAIDESSVLERGANSRAFQGEVDDLLGNLPPVPPELETVSQREAFATWFFNLVPWLDPPNESFLYSHVHAYVVLEILTEAFLKDSVLRPNQDSDRDHFQTLTLAATGQLGDRGVIEKSVTFLMSRPPVAEEPEETEISFEAPILPTGRGPIVFEEDEPTADAPEIKGKEGRIKRVLLIILLVLVLSLLVLCSVYLFRGLSTVSEKLDTTTELAQSNSSHLTTLDGRLAELWNHYMTIEEEKSSLIKERDTLELSAASWKFTAEEGLQRERRIQLQADLARRDSDRALALIWALSQQLEEQSERSLQEQGAAIEDSVFPLTQLVRSGECSDPSLRKTDKGQVAIFNCPIAGRSFRLTCRGSTAQTATRCVGSK